ncbi:hypothetical protein [Sphingomonas sp. BK235]|uniref:hypothetical protein n=1 Tax=Sphingomonas sp. BK235 TaxID=2512131 RepID=UPI0010435272|nr:hypothetical protein [Sphingomonas sp. BK235]TCP33369.1 hypothetical protein EV292_106312 [Sphingomonas sp. BK235]
MYVSTQRRDRQPAPATPPLVDNPFAAELFATGCAGFTHLGGTVVVTLESARCDHSGAEPLLERVVAGRIALTVAGAQALAAGLQEFLERQHLGGAPSPTRRGAFG